ncbi:MAG TPA: RNA polymerase sigma-54 factor [Bacteroidetes bacterium]|nr:RNA polymerase sigma-54 factor [Bacteroidota bacterium]
MKLLQVPAIALEQRIKEEMEANPVLEEGEEVEEFDENESSIEENDEQKDEMEQALEDFDYEEYTDDYIPEYKTRANNYSADDEDKSTPIVYYDSFLSGLEAQLGYLNLDENETQLAATLVGNLDDNGYLGRELESIVNDLAFTQGIETTYEELERILMLIQDFDPPGIGARDLNECLLIQLLKKDQDNPQIHLATKIIEKNFNAFAKKHYQKLIDKFEITEEELKEAIDEITKLNPKPGGSISGNKVSNQAIIPDFILTNNDGKLGVVLTSPNMPELRISRDYKEMLKAYAEGGKQSKEDKKGLFFVKQKIDSAKWFIDAIRQRQNTLLNTAEAIVNYQRDYFQDGDETQLKPMILKNIAEIVHLDISTISRVVNSKYIQTPFGTFLLKKLFSESLSTESGEEVSTIEVKRILQNIIEKEDKKHPLTDEKLALLLKEKKYNIARRTVAKYREQLNIPVGRLRKKL